MKIQFFSDVHLEFGELEAAPTDADVIVAAGDISVGDDGVRWLRAFDKPVIYVAGNHEYYGGEIGAVQAAIRRAAAGSQVHFLECEALDIDGVRFLGTTLWTDYLGGDEELMAALKPQMNDYLQIRCGGRALEPADLLAINAHARDWLATELARGHSGPTVVVTHHAPLLESWRADQHAEFRPAYCNDLGELMAGNDIDLWIHGHVHQAFSYLARDVHVVCNPRGYHGYQVVDRYDTAKTIELVHA